MFRSPPADLLLAAVRAEASGENGAAIILRWISYSLFSLTAIATILAISGTVLERRSERLRAPASPPPPSTSLPPGAGPPETVSSEIGHLEIVPAPAAGSTERSGGAMAVKLVVLDAVSVIFDQARVHDFVLGFVRRHGGSVWPDELVETYDQLTAGTIDTGSWWRWCGIAGDPDTLDESYVQARGLRAGVRGCLEAMDRRGVAVAAVSNDAASWSLGTRARHGLEMVEPWVVSADTGSPMPHVGLLQQLCRDHGVEPGQCLFIDTDVASLDVAASAGMQTAWLGPDPLAVFHRTHEGQHRLIPSLAALDDGNDWVGGAGKALLP